MQNNIVIAQPLPQEQQNNMPQMVQAVYTQQPNQNIQTFDANVPHMEIPQMSQPNTTEIDPMVIFTLSKYRYKKKSIKCWLCFSICCNVLSLLQDMVGIFYFIYMCVDSEQLENFNEQNGTDFSQGIAMLIVLLYLLSFGIKLGTCYLLFLMYQALGRNDTVKLMKYLKIQLIIFLVSTVACLFIGGLGLFLIVLVFGGSFFALWFWYVSTWIKVTEILKGKNVVLPSY